MKSPALAIVLSSIIPGLGQIYAGRILRGMAILFTMIILAIISFILSFILIGIFGWIIEFIIWLWNIFDAYSLVSKGSEAVQATRVQIGKIITVPVHMLRE